MAILILALLAAGLGVREASAVASSHSQWASLFLTQEEGL